MTERRRYKIAVLGGTGAQGSGLALRLAAAGHTVTIGSRSADKARAAAAELSAKLDDKSIAGDDNRQAAAAAEIVMLTVPYAVQKATVDEVLDQIAGKILIDATVPLVPPKVSVVQLPEGQSAVAAIQQRVGSQTRVVSAFQNVSAPHLADLHHDIDCDVLVCGDDAPACDDRDRSDRGHRHARALCRADPQLRRRRGADLRADHHQPPSQSDGLGDPHHRIAEDIASSTARIVRILRRTYAAI